MIFRINRQNNFTLLSNEVINDSSIGWNDLGLLIYLLSKPEHWKVSVKHLATIRKSGREALYSSLKRLQKIGYAKYTRHASGSTDWSIYDTPQAFESDEPESYPQATSGKAGYGIKASSGKASSGKASSGFSSRIVSTDLLESTEKKESTELGIKITDENILFSMFFYKRIKILNKNCLEPNWSNWSDTIRIMREKDNRTCEQIEAVFIWANQDDFWKSNILSPRSLREKFDVLETKMINPNKKTTQLSKEYIDKHANVGETYDEARKRLERKSEGE